MRLRLITALTLILITTLMSASMIVQTGTTAKATASPSQNAPQVKRKPVQPDLPGTVSGATHPEAIPDTIAYELFMRSVADYPSEYLLKDLGLSRDHAANLLSFLQSFELVVGALDHATRYIRGTRRNIELVQLQKQKLAQLQKQKERFLERELNHYLTSSLGAEGAGKIRSFINARVKPKTKKLPVEVANGVYVYTNAWHDGENVYGSGTISSDYSDFNQYLVTTTVISPNGSRYSTSQTGWEYAAVTDTEYLPLMPNGGTFTVESVFEGTNGYMASAVNAVTAAKIVSIAFAQTIPAPPLTAPAPTTVANSSAQIVAQVSFSDDTVQSDFAEVELVHAANPNLVEYTVDGNSGEGTTTGNSNRVVRVTAGTTRFRTINWPITVTSAGTGLFGAVAPVGNTVRFNTLSPGVTAGTDNVPVVFLVGAAPTRSPSRSSSRSPSTPNRTPTSGGSGPIVVDIAGNGFRLTNTVDGVSFDLDHSGTKEQTAWTDRGSDDAFLVLDRNGNGTIDNGTELFSNITPQPDPPDGVARNGFLALAEYDKTSNGGYQDGEIDRNDAVFASLRLWQDANHNGISEWTELRTLTELNLESISLDFRVSKRTDQYGNQFRYRARVKNARGEYMGHWAWDVFFVAP